MNITDFIQRVKYHEHTWNFILNNARKRYEFESKMSHLNRQLKTYTTNEYINGVAEEDKVHYLDFIKGNFWDKPIPEFKIQKNI